MAVPRFKRGRIRSKKETKLTRKCTKRKARSKIEAASWIESAKSCVCMSFLCATLSISCPGIWFWAGGWLAGGGSSAFSLAPVFLIRVQWPLAPRDKQSRLEEPDSPIAGTFLTTTFLRPFVFQAPALLADWSSRARPVVLGRDHESTNTGDLSFASPARRPSEPGPAPA